MRDKLEIGPILCVVLAAIVFVWSIVGNLSRASSDPAAPAIIPCRVEYSAGTLHRRWESITQPVIKSSFGGIECSFRTTQGDVLISGFGSVVVEPIEKVEASQ